MHDPLLAQTHPEPPIQNDRGRSCLAASLSPPIAGTIKIREHVVNKIYMMA
jgi:hypothetical protein